MAQMIREASEEVCCGLIYGALVQALILYSTFPG